MPRFWDFVKQTNSSAGKLPLTHATDLFHFRQIRGTSTLDPTKCDVYGTKLLYFFYGRPSYRPHAQLATIDAKAFLPVCMLMSSEIIDKAVRIMPFDSGAFHHQKMHPPMHKEMALDDFELAVDATAPMRLVDLFYGNERKYFDAAAKKELGGYDEFEDLEIDSYFRLLHHRSNSPTDDRVSAVEIQIADPIALAGQVHAVILPRQFLDRPGVVTQIESWGAIAIPYNVKEEFIPREAQGAIFEKIAEYLEQEGMLDPP